MKRGEMLSKAIHLATNAHHGQFDKGGKPYILHALAVMHLLNSDDEELQCAAVMHDVIEDTKTTYAELQELGFTERTIDIVRGVTRLPGQTEEEYKAQVMETKDRMLVKRADLTHNSDINRLKGVREKDAERMVKYHIFFLEIKQKLGGM